MRMLETFKSLPEDPIELRAVSELMAAEIKAQAYQIEKLKKELAGHRKARFGAKSESMDQLAFDLQEDTEIEAAAEASSPMVELRLRHRDGGYRWFEIHFSPYPLPLGQTLEWGVNVHLGQEFGIANQIVLAAACAGIVLLCVASGVMWWMRRPAGRLGVPPAPHDPRKLRGVLALLAIGGVIFPLVGASMIAMALVDAGIRRWSARPTIQAAR